MYFIKLGKTLAVNTLAQYLTVVLLSYACQAGAYYPDIKPWDQSSNYYGSSGSTPLSARKSVPYNYGTTSSRMQPTVVNNIQSTSPTQMPLTVTQPMQPRAEITQPTMSQISDPATSFYDPLYYYQPTSVPLKYFNYGSPNTVSIGPYDDPLTRMDNVMYTPVSTTSQASNSIQCNYIPTSSQQNSFLSTSYPINTNYVSPSCSQNNYASPATSMQLANCMLPGSSQNNYIPSSSQICYKSTSAQKNCYIPTSTRGENCYSSYNPYHTSYNVPTSSQRNNYPSYNKYPCYKQPDIAYYEDEQDPYESNQNGPVINGNTLPPQLPPRGIIIYDTMDSINPQCCNNIIYPLCGPIFDSSSSTATTSNTNQTSTNITKTNAVNNNKLCHCKKRNDNKNNSKK